MTSDTKGIFFPVCTLIACGLAFVLLGCAPKKDTAFSTSTVIGLKDMPRDGNTHFGDPKYAVVRHDALPAINAEFRSVLAKFGLVKWDERFDCNKFAALYIAVAQTKYASLAWNTYAEAQSLALAEFWYWRNGKTLHAVVQAITDKGVIFIDPQTGFEAKLTKDEQESVVFRKW